MKNVNIGDTVYYKLRPDDIRTGRVTLYAPNVNGKEMYKISRCEFWFTKEQLYESEEELLKADRRKD